MIKFGGFFGKTSNLLVQTKKSLGYAVLVGIIPTIDAGSHGLNNVAVSRSTLARCSPLTITQMHALDQRNSIYAGMLMFTETEVLQLRNLSKVSRSL
jgi:hypothetical protein